VKLAKHKPHCNGADGNDDGTRDVYGYHCGGSCVAFEKAGYIWIEMEEISGVAVVRGADVSR
jgi:hypothetical protein